MKDGRLFKSDNWFEVDFSRWGSKTQDNTTFELLKGAVISHRAVGMMYVNSHGEKRKIYPLKNVTVFWKWKSSRVCRSNRLRA